MKIPVYVAGASRELPRVQRYVELLESSGLVQITHRWFDAVAEWGVGRDAELTLEQQRKHANDDMGAVVEAEVVWVLFPEGPSTGAFIEFGAAYMAGAQVVVTGAKASACIFTALADYRDPEDDCGLHEVLRLVRKRIQEVSEP